jgi:hypothetical protein
VPEHVELFRDTGGLIWQNSPPFDLKGYEIHISPSSHSVHHREIDNMCLWFLIPALYFSQSPHFSLAGHPDYQKTVSN